MKMTRQPLIFAVSLAAVLALSACGKKDESASTMPAATPPPASEPAATPPSEVAPAAVSFDSLALGSGVDAGNKVSVQADTFTPKDSIYASVATHGNGMATLAAKWSYQDGQVVHEDSKSIDATGPASTAFMISKPDGFPAGNYKVEITLNGSPVASKDFSVK